MMGGLMLSLKNEIVKLAPRARINTIAPGGSELQRRATALLGYRIMAEADTSWVVQAGSLLRWLKMPCSRSQSFTKPWLREFAFRSFQAGVDLQLKSHSNPPPVPTAPL